MVGRIRSANAEDRVKWQDGLFAGFRTENRKQEDRGLYSMRMRGSMLRPLLSQFTSTI